MPGRTCGRSVASPRRPPSGRPPVPRPASCCAGRSWNRSQPGPNTATWPSATPSAPTSSASTAQRDREREDDRQRRAREAQAERRARTRLRALVAVFAATALIAGILTVIARNQSERAARQARIASARELAAAASANVSVDPERSILLAIEAVRRTRSVDGFVLPEAEEALHRAVTASRVVLTVPGIGGRLDWSQRGSSSPRARTDRESSTSGTLRPERRVHAFRAHHGDVTDVAFSADGTKLATTGDDGVLNIWDPSTGRQLASVQANEAAFGPSFSADGSMVAAAWGDNTVRVLDLSTDRRVVWTSPADTADAALSPDGKRLAVTTLSRNGAVFDAETGDRLFALRGSGPTEIPKDRDVSWSPNRRFIATTNVDGIPRVWDARTGGLLFTLKGQAGFVVTVAWSPDSSRLVTGGTDGTAKVWELRDDGARAVLSLSAQEMSEGIRGVAFSADGTQVMAGGRSTVKIWDVGPEGGTEWADLPSFGGLADFMPDGRRVVTSSGKGAALTIWDVQTRRKLRTIPLPFEKVSLLDVSPDGRSIAASGAERNGDSVFDVAGVWDPATGEERFLVRHYGNGQDAFDINDVAFSSDGKYLVTAGWDGSASIFDRSGNVVRVLGGYESEAGLAKARFSADGRLVATVVYGNDSLVTDPGLNRVEVWGREDGSLIRRIPTVFRGVLDVDPSHSRIVMLDQQGRAEILDAESARQVAVLAGRLGDLNDITFSADGSLVATAGSDGTVRLFEADTGAQRLVLPGACGVSDVAFSADGTKLASASPCDGVRIWALDIDDLLQFAQQKVTRPLTDEECRQYLHEDRCSSA